MPQLKAAIKELQEQGLRICRTTRTSPPTTTRSEIKARYDKVKGSAVNPVLREGNSDRRAPLSVKKYARKHPHSHGRVVARTRKSHVAHMDGGDFYGSEKSATLANAGSLKIELQQPTAATDRAQGKDARSRPVRSSTRAVMSRNALAAFYRRRRSPTPRPRACCSRCTSRPP